MTEAFIPLQSGEPIGVVALSGPVDSDLLEAGLEVLGDWGHPVVVAPNVSDRYGDMAGNDSARLAGLEWVLEQGARVLIAARGGYGSGRLLADMPWRRLVATRSCFVGFSDVTAVMTALLGRGGGVQIHGPMVAAGLTNPRNEHQLRRALDGELIGQPVFTFSQTSVIRPGCVRGPAMGGNLALLTSLLGTDHQPNLDGCVVLLEEVGEPLYRLDRMLTQLYRSGTFRRVKALISGSLRNCRPAAERAERWRRLLEEVAPSDAVLAVDLPFGHGSQNLAFPLGATVEVDTDSGVVNWSC